MPFGSGIEFSEGVTGDSAERYILVANGGVVALPGGMAPDFILPPDFIQTDGGVLGSTVEFWSKKLGRYGSALMWHEFSSDDLPGGSISLNRNYGDPGIFGEAAEASPTNYAGEIGTVPEPSPALLLGASLAVLGLQVRRARISSTRAQRWPIEG